MRRCSCCQRVAVPGLPFACTCTDELFCRTCAHCEKHCQCTEAARQLDVPLTEQLSIAQYEAKRMGVLL